MQHTLEHSLIYVDSAMQIQLQSNLLNCPLYKQVVSLSEQAQLLLELGTCCTFDKETTSVSENFGILLPTCAKGVLTVQLFDSGAVPVQPRTPTSETRRQL